AVTLPGFRPVPDHRVALVGARDVDAGERAALAGAGVTLVPVASVGMLGGILRRTLAGAEAAVAHVDLDVLDPDAVGAANAYAAPGGLSAEGLVEAVRAVRDALPVRAATLSAYDPAGDPEARVARVALDVARVLVGVP
ncbi:MAG TPA: arginase family protein, partial [Rhodothermales bacterium]|nr:arginase family protein [Rhodothermales bacterium]